MYNHRQGPRRAYWPARTTGSGLSLDHRTPPLGRSAHLGPAPLTPRRRHPLPAPNTRRATRKLPHRRAALPGLPGHQRGDRQPGRHGPDTQPAWGPAHRPGPARRRRQLPALGPDHPHRTQLTRRQHRRSAAPPTAGRARQPAVRAHPSRARCARALPARKPGAASTAASRSTGHRRPAISSRGPLWHRRRGGPRAGRPCVQ